MRTNRMLAAAALAFLLAVPAIPAAAQTGQLGSGLSFERYGFGDAEVTGIESLTLMTLPFGGRALLARDFSLELSGAYASGRLARADGGESKLSGLTDTNLRATFALPDQRFVLGATFSAPTGHATQTIEESEVAGAIAADLLPFRITNWGSGGGVSADASFLSSLGGTNVGLNVGYGIAREFEPLADDQRAYLPGNQLLVRLAFDRNVSASGKMTLILAMQRFGSDELSGANLYRSGNRLQSMLSYAFAVGAQSSAVVYGGWNRRQRGTFLDATLLGTGDETPAQDLILAGGGMRRPLGTGAILPRADVRVFRSSDGIGQGYAFGLGVGTETPVGGLTLLPVLNARFGNVLVREDQKSGFTGLTASLTVRFGR
jgi:hypothetical protein